MNLILLIASLGAPLITLVAGWKQRFTLLWIYAAAGLVIDNLGMLVRSLGFDQHFLGNIFFLIQLCVISAYYRKIVFRNVGIYFVITGILTVGFIAHTIWSSIWVVNFMAAGILCAIYLVYGILGYLSIIRNKAIISLRAEPLFWINTAFFIFAATTSLLFLFDTYLKSTSFELFMKVWLNFFTIINIMHYIFIGVGLYKTTSREV